MGGPRRSQKLNVKGTEEHEREERGGLRVFSVWGNRDLVLINSPRSMLLGPAISSKPRMKERREICVRSREKSWSRKN